LLKLNIINYLLKQKVLKYILEINIIKYYFIIFLTKKKKKKKLKWEFAKWRIILMLHFTRLDKRHLSY